jgi:hypothetical protein
MLQSFSVVMEVMLDIVEVMLDIVEVMLRHVM